MDARVPGEGVLLELQILVSVEDAIAQRLFLLVEREGTVRLEMLELEDDGCGNEATVDDEPLRIGEEGTRGRSRLREN